MILKSTKSCLPTMIKYVTCVMWNHLLRDFIINWKSHQILPSLAPLLVENFTEIFQANIKGEDMAPFIKEAPYEVGVINAKIFEDNIGYKESKIILFRKFCVLHPDKILEKYWPLCK